MNLWYSMRKAYDEGSTAHPQLVMKGLGIKYEVAIPQSIVDQWWFLGCSCLPNPLPNFLHPLDLTAKEEEKWRGGEK